MKSPSKTVFEIILVIAVILAVAVSPKAAEAAGMEKHGPVPFTEFDADGSGFVSEEEFNTTRANHMAEMAKAGRPMKGMATAPSFSDIDTDGDSQLSEAELAAGHAAHMKVMKESGHQGMGHGMGKGKHKGKCKGHGRTKSRDEKAEKKMPTFEDIDTDADGMISPEEFAAHQAAHHGKQH